MVKRPEEINVYPLDVKKDENGGLWFRVPSWIVRAYRLKHYGTNMGKVKFIIKATKRAMFEYHGEEKGKNYYYEKNWAKKIRRERRKHSENEDNTQEGKNEQRTNQARFNHRSP